MEKKKNSKKVLGVLSLIIAAVILFGAYKTFAPKPVEGGKKITVTVVHKGGDEKEFIYETDEEYLAPVITGDGLAEGEEGQYGLFITTVDGYQADTSKEEWWCITKGGESVNTSANETVIEDGDKFELTLTEGY